MLRRWINLAGITFTVLAAGLWVLSGWYWMDIQMRSEAVDLLCGDICYMHGTGSAEGLHCSSMSLRDTPFGIGAPPSYRLWDFDFEGTTPYGARLSATLPFWIFVLAYPLCAVLAWGLRKRRAALGCPACGYSRSGLPPQAPCPECGRA